VPTALAIHPLSKLRDLSKLRGILANRIKYEEPRIKLWGFLAFSYEFLKGLSQKVGPFCILIDIDRSAGMKKSERRPIGASLPHRIFTISLVLYHRASADYKLPQALDHEIRECILKTGLSDYEWLSS
jgi:hypothetical protein